MTVDSSNTIVRKTNLKGLGRQTTPSIDENNLLDKLKRVGLNASINDWADYWFYVIGVNVIPADTKNKITIEKWSQWQNEPIPDELHEE